MKKYYTALGIILIFAIVLCAVSCGSETNTSHTDATVTNAPGTDTQTTTQTEPPKYTVTFANTSLPAQTLISGSSLAKPSDPSKADHIFDGWYTDDACTSRAVFPMVITDDTTLYANFYSYQTAFEEAREKTIGANVDGYEFDYTLNSSVSYSIIKLNGNTSGNSKYNKNSDTSFYDVHENSGMLFIDGTKYQIRKGTTLQKITENEKGKVTDSKAEEVGSDYLFDSSSFAKALFTYTPGQLKEIKRTSNPNEYELKTSFNFSQALEILGTYIDSDTVKNLIGNVPETDVQTGIYVTFANGQVSKYRYEIHISVKSVQFDLVYNLAFKNPGKAPTISPKSFPGF